MKKQISNPITAICIVLAAFAAAVTPNVYAQEEPVYTGDKVPGDPENGVVNLQRVYKGLQIYRARHNGQYPKTQGGLMIDMFNHLPDYGFINIGEAIAYLGNPDNKYDDHFSVRRDPQKMGTAAIFTARADGSSLGGPKQIATFDVLSFTATYYHLNEYSYKAGRNRANPTGFYLALYDDGSVGQVAYDQVVFVYEPTIGDTGSLTIAPAFPHQAGVPYNSLTYEEYCAALLPANSPAFQPPIGFRIPVGQSEPVPDNGGAESLLQFLRLLDRPIRREEVWKSLTPTHIEFTLSDIAQSAATLKLPLQRARQSITQLQARGGPAIFLTNDDKRIVTLAQVDDDRAIVLDRGLTRIVDRAVLEKRYGGEALLAGDANAKSSVQVDDTVRSITMPSQDAEVTQTSTVTNRGTTPLTLQIERPIPGVTEAQLSKDTLAPGQSATLTLKLKWRTVLHGETQSVFVTLKTNDAVQPRTQLGFQLRLATAP